MGGSRRGGRELFGAGGTIPRIGATGLTLGPPLRQAVLALQRGTREDRGGTREDRGGTREDRGGTREDRGGTRENREGTRENREGMREDREGMRENREGTREDREGTREDRGGTREDRGGTRENRGGTRENREGMRAPARLAQPLPARPLTMPLPPSPANILLTLAACLLLAACAPLPPSALEAENPDPGREIELQAAFEIDPTTPILLPLRGGTTGDPYALTCAEDEVVVGLRGRSGTTVTALGLVCARMQENGALVDRDDRPTIGATTGNVFYSECPQTEAVIEVRGRAGTTLDRVGVRCARVRRWVQLGTPGSIEPSYGGTGGAPFTDGCPPGYFLQGVLGFAGATIASMQGLCVPITS